MDVLRVHTLYQYLTKDVFMAFFLLPFPQELVRIVFDLWSLLWCIQEHSNANSAVIARRLMLDNMGISFKAYECDCCRNLHLGFDYDFLSFNTENFPTLPHNVFVEYNSWLEKKSSELFNLSVDRLYITNNTFTLYEINQRFGEKPLYDSDFENFLIPYYKDARPHAFIKTLKRRDKEMNDYNNKRRRIS